MAHKVHLYDVKKGFDADGVMRPVEVIETTDSEEAIRIATGAVEKAHSISAAYIHPDWRLCATLGDYFHLTNAIGRWLEANPIPNSWIGQLMEEPEHWAEYGVHTPEELEKHLLIQSYSDTFKETYGFRPRHRDFTMETPIEEIEAAYAAIRPSSEQEDAPGF